MFLEENSQQIKKNLVCIYLLYFSAYIYFTVLAHDVLSSIPRKLSTMTHDIMLTINNFNKYYITNAQHFLVPIDYIFIGG